MSISSVNCSPIRPNFGQEQTKQKENNTKPKVKTVDFDKAADVINGIDISNLDERSARNIAKLADAINETKENEKYTKPLKQFITTVSLALASGIVAKGTARKFVQAIEKNVPILDWVAKEGTRYGQKFASGIHVSEARNFKGFVSRLANDSVNWVKGFANKGLNKNAVADFVEKNAKNLDDATEVAFLKDAAATQNCIKKVISNVAGISAGVGVVAQTTKDKNEDGIPDMFQGKEAKEDILRDKLIDAAIETIMS